MKKLTIDSAVCQAHGQCELTARDLVCLDDDGFGMVLGTGEVAEQHLTSARLAVPSCPMQAVQLEDV